MKMIRSRRPFGKIALVLAVGGIGLWVVLNLPDQRERGAREGAEGQYSQFSRDGEARQYSASSVSPRVARQLAERGNEESASPSVRGLEALQAVAETSGKAGKVALGSFPKSPEELSRWTVGEWLMLPVGDGNLILEGRVAMNVLRDDGGRALRVELGDENEEGVSAGELFANIDADGRIEGFIRYVGDAGVYRLTGTGETSDLEIELCAVEDLLCSFGVDRPDGMITPEEAAVPQSVVPPTAVIRPPVVMGESTVSIGDVNMAEGQKKGNVMRFPVLSGIPSGAGKSAISVQWTLVAESASAGSDFKAAKGKLTLKRGQTEGVISVTLKGDRVPEGNETFRVILSNPINATLGKAEGIGTILDDEWFSVVVPDGSLRVREPDGDVAKKSMVRLLPFVVTPAVAEPVSFSWKLNPGTATSKDFKTKGGTVRLTAGQSAFTIPVTILGDGLIEEDETFSVTFSKLPPMIGAEAATVTIEGSEIRQPGPVGPSPVPAWESRPGASKVIYLEFNGASLSGTVWNKTNAAIITQPVFAKFGDEGCEAIWSMVAEAYRPFDVNVTTSKAVFEATSPTHRTWCLFTAEPAKFNSNAAGLAYMDSFGKASWQPALVFADGDYTWDSFGTIAIHELGHTLGLSHDGKGAEEYYGGHEGGVKSWGPWMGVPYYRFYRQFSKGEYPGATRKEDDLSLIARYFPLLADESGAALELPLQQDGADPVMSGVITDRTDIDVYRLSVPAASAVTIRLMANQPGNYSLAPHMRILDQGGRNVAPGAAGWSAGDGTLTWTGTLVAGDYQIEVDGVGDPSDPGFTDYGSIGYYAIQATR